jgi:hypothetical protein
MLQLKLLTQPEPAGIDSAKKAETEAKNARAQTSFSATCPPEKRVKQTPQEEAACKRFWDHNEKTGELCGPDFPKYELIKAVVGLIGIIDGEEELSYIDEDILMETDKTDPQASAPEKNDMCLTEKADLTKGSEAKSPIDLDSADINVHEEGLSRSPPPTFDEVEQTIQALIRDSGAQYSEGMTLCLWRSHVP